MRNIHGGFPCDICKETFQNIEESDFHRVNQHGVKDYYKCTFCSETFDFRESYFYHRNTNHAEDVHKEKLVKRYNNVFICPFCEHSTYSNAYLNDHILAKHSDEKHFQCEQCGKKLKTKRQLKAHIIDTHNPVNCDLCNRKFGGKRMLKIHHLNVHAQDKPHKCDMCQKSFGMLHVLRKHKKNVHKIDD